MKQAYITALTSALLVTKDVEAVLTSTKALLKEKGHERLWPGVLKGVVRALEKYEIDQTPEITLAKEGALSVAELKAALAEINVASETIRTTIDPNIVGGFILQHQDTMLDKSYKRALVDIYQKVTK